tara:strand:+ start:99866 stop:100180 length:315 start_codon:yes stop_codon:yes gene_type:complete
MSKKKYKRKSYTLNLPLTITQRLHCIKKLRKGKIDMGWELTKYIMDALPEIEKKCGINKDTWKELKKCPKCDSYLLPKKGKKGKFYGCYNYPQCKHTENLKDNE